MTPTPPPPFLTNPNTPQHPNPTHYTHTHTLTFEKKNFIMKKCALWKEGRKRTCTHLTLSPYIALVLLICKDDRKRVLYLIGVIVSLSHHNFSCLPSLRIFEVIVWHHGRTNPTYLVRHTWVAPSKIHIEDKIFNWV